MSLPLIAAIVTLGSFLTVSWPEPLAHTDLSVEAGQARNYLDTVPTLAPVPQTTVATTTPPTTVAEPPAASTQVVSRPRGRSVRVGVAPPASSPATIAHAVVDSVALYSSPGQAEPDDWFDNPTWEGLPVVFLVHGRQGDWLNVQISMRPNQATVWIRASDVRLTQTSYRILVDTNAATLTAYNGSSVVMQASVAPGKGSTPTPLGDFFVDGIVAPNDPTGPYGPYQVSVSGFSNVYTSFGGGIGQIAIHGTNSPALIGTPASNGCVRMNNEDIEQLVQYIPVGTPVRIV